LHQSRAFVALCTKTVKFCLLSSELNFVSNAHYLH
jgi:hypothetical protein